MNISFFFAHLPLYINQIYDSTATAIVAGTPIAGAQKQKHIELPNSIQSLKDFNLPPSIFNASSSNNNSISFPPQFNR